MEAGLRPGSMLAGFRVEQRIGAGGMGAVFLARDATLDRLVALKVMAPELADDPRYRERFLQEAKVVANLEHAAIVPVYAAGESDGRLYLAMRFVPGGSLAQRLEQEGPLTVAGTLRILGPIADALDAAHAAGLVHRDVKPANVLIEGERSYLADFGLARNVGTVESFTAGAPLQLSGTMGYLAPEQIEGEAATARSDQYALACVLFACLAGRGPFSAQDELAVVYAHLTEPPPSLTRLRPELPPAVDAVLARGLAKHPRDRYPSCGELVAALADACRSSATAPAPVRRRATRRLLAGGVLAVVATVAATAVVVGTRGGGSRAASASSPAAPAGPPPDSVAVVDIAHGRVIARVPVGSTPSAVAVGAGRVWVVNADDGTVTRLDAATHVASSPFAIGATPVDVAADQSSVWLTTISPAAVASSRPTLVDSVTQLDPATGSVLAHVSLARPQGDIAIPAARGQIALGGAFGSVWVVQSDGSVAKVDPQTRRVVAVTHGIVATQLATGLGDVWALGRQLWRIDSQTGTVTLSVALQTRATTSLAVASGAVWVADPLRGVVIRVDYYPALVTTTIPTAPGASVLTADGSTVWAANPLDGTVVGIATAANRVTRRLTVGGTPRAIVAADGTAWIPTLGTSLRSGVAAAAPQSGDIRLPACGSVYRLPGTRPQFLIASELAPPDGDPQTNESMLAAVRIVLQDHGFRAGRFTLGYQACEEPTSDKQCAADAGDYVRATKLIGIVGTYYSSCAWEELPTLNRAPAGPLAVISPTNTDPGLTVTRELVPSGRRGYARVAVDDTRQFLVDIELARELGIRRLYLVRNSSELFSGFDPFFDLARSRAPRLGVSIAGNATFSPFAPTYLPLVQRIARSRADGVFLNAAPTAAAGKVIEALRAKLGRDLPILTWEWIPPTSGDVGRAARGVYTTTWAPAIARLGPTGQKWVRRFAATRSDGRVPAAAPATALATEALLDAIARSDGTRASVSRELLETRIANGILGSFAFTPNGDITPATLTVLRIVGENNGPPAAEPEFEGAVVDRTVTVSP